MKGLMFVAGGGGQQQRHRPPRHRGLRQSPEFSEAIVSHFTFSCPMRLAMPWLLGLVAELGNEGVVRSRGCKRCGVPTQCTTSTSSEAWPA